MQRWGEPRVTVDADLTLLTGFESEAQFIASLLQNFRPRRPDAAEFALARRVLLLTASNDVPLDVALGGVPFEERSVERSSLWTVSENIRLTTCSPEDLVIHKTFASRARDWLDLERIVQRQGNRLNFRLIFEELRPLLELKEEPENEERLRQLMKREGLEIEEL